MEFFWGPMLGDNFIVSAKVEESKYLFRQLIGSAFGDTLQCFAKQQRKG